MFVQVYAWLLAGGAPGGQLGSYMLVAPPADGSVARMLNSTWRQVMPDAPPGPTKALWELVGIPARAVSTGRRVFSKAVYRHVKIECLRRFRLDHPGVNDADLVAIPLPVAGQDALGNLPNMTWPCQIQVYAQNMLVSEAWRTALSCTLNR